MNRSCPICNSKRLEFLKDKMINDTTYTLFLCKECDIQFWHPLKASIEFYENERLDLYKYIHKGRKGLEARFKKFFEYHPEIKGKRILDIGCGDGIFLESLMLYNEVYGVDIDRRSVEIAKSRGLKNIFAMDINRFISYCNEKGIVFDIITAFDVIEHLTDPLTVLKGLKSILKEGGEIIGTVPNRERWFSEEIKTDLPPHHFYRFSKRALKNILDKAGYEVKSVEQFEYGYINKIIFTKLMDPLRERVISKNSSKTEEKGEREKKDLSLIKLCYRMVKEITLKTTEPPSILFEKVTKKGFKLYFEAIKVKN